MRITTNILRLLTAPPSSPNSRIRLTPSTHPVLAISRLHQSLLISFLPAPPTKDALDTAIRVSAASAAGLSNILSSEHPVTAVALAELGKLLAVDEPTPDATNQTQGSSTFPPSGTARLRLAEETLRRAYDAATIGFGRDGGGGVVGRDIRTLLASVEKELNVWGNGLRDIARFG